MGIPLSLGDVSHRSAAVTAICVAVPVLGELAARLGIQVLAVGDLGRLIAVGATDAGGTGEYLADVDALTGRLRSLVRPRDVVLVKASRGLALERVAEALAATTDEGDPA